MKKASRLTGPGAISHQFAIAKEFENRRDRLGADRYPISDQV